MSKPYPEMIILKQRKCPDCGEQLGHPPLRLVDNAVQAVCRNKSCDFRQDLFFLGDSISWAN